MNKEAAAQFVVRLLHAVTDSHIMHFQSRSFSQHMALGGLYEGLGDLVDSFTEAYQGKYGIIEEYPDGYIAPGKDALIEITDLSETIKSMRKDVPQDSELQNIIDEIAALIDSTIYKLRFLK